MPDTPTPTPTPALPPRLLNMVEGHVLIAYTDQTRPGDKVRQGVAIFAAPEAEGHAFVVWTLYRWPDLGWQVEAGDYVQTLGAALSYYQIRGGQ